ncbi:hypothetical protein CYMTET_10254 [Cymbomonas tetramitiformis]|uniref:Uncharacterized protein n=1 Tax=Cymbomonas tetramitiformis TaxID=36881 RepID=A0AAE0GR30_9CHLO|nr:hypothetical protein CYMTET_10254 [Cymbomonas tetramitiformis]
MLLHFSMCGYCTALAPPKAACSIKSDLRFPATNSEAFQVPGGLQSSPFLTTCPPRICTDDVGHTGATPAALDVPLATPPPLPSAALPKLETLLPGSPSPNLRWHLLDVLYSYCLTLRVYNGDWQSCPEEAAETLLTVSAVLGIDGGGSARRGRDKRASMPSGSTQSVSISSAKGALGGAMERAVGFGGPLHSSGSTRAAAKAGLLDVAQVLAGERASVVCALHDVQRLLGAAISTSKTERGSGLDASMREFRQPRALVEDEMARELERSELEQRWAGSQEGASGGLNSMLTVQPELPQNPGIQRHGMIQEINR